MSDNIKQAIGLSRNWDDISHLAADYYIGRNVNRVILSDFFRVIYQFGRADQKRAQKRKQQLDAALKALSEYATNG